MRFTYQPVCPTKNTCKNSSSSSTESDLIGTFFTGVFFFGVDVLFLWVRRQAETWLDGQYTMRMNLKQEKKEKHWEQHKHWCTREWEIQLSCIHKNQRTAANCASGALGIIIRNTFHDIIPVVPLLSLSKLGKTCWKLKIVKVSPLLNVESMNGLKHHKKGLAFQHQWLNKLGSKFFALIHIICTRNVYPNMLETGFRFQTIISYKSKLQHELEISSFL